MLFSSSIFINKQCTKVRFPSLVLLCTKHICRYNFSFNPITNQLLQMILKDPYPFLWTFLFVSLTSAAIHQYLYFSSISIHFPFIMNELTTFLTVFLFSVSSDLGLPPPWSVYLRTCSGNLFSWFSMSLQLLSRVMYTPLVSKFETPHQLLN